MFAHFSIANKLDYSQSFWWLEKVKKDEVEDGEGDFQNQYS